MGGDSMKIVINTCFGGFGLSIAAEELYLELTGNTGEPGPDDGPKKFYDFEVKRDDPTLVAVVERLGSKAAGSCAELKVVEVPEGVQWHISDYDGAEHVAENHRTWS
jgi:hypothetical protein